MRSQPRRGSSTGEEHIQSIGPHGGSHDALIVGLRKIVVENYALRSETDRLQRGSNVRTCCRITTEEGWGDGSAARAGPNGGRAVLRRPSFALGMLDVTATDGIVSHDGTTVRLRTRLPTAHEGGADSSADRLRQRHGNRIYAYRFDHVLGETEPLDALRDELSPVVDACLQGFSGCVLSLGHPHMASRACVLGGVRPASSGVSGYIAPASSADDAAALWDDGAAVALGKLLFHAAAERSSEIECEMWGSAVLLGDGELHDLLDGVGAGACEGERAAASGSGDETGAAPARRRGETSIEISTGSESEEPYRHVGAGTDADARAKRNTPALERSGSGLHARSDGESGGSGPAGARLGRRGGGGGDSSSKDASSGSSKKAARRSALVRVGARGRGDAGSASKRGGARGRGRSRSSSLGSAPSSQTPARRPSSRASTSASRTGTPAGGLQASGPTPKRPLQIKQRPRGQTEVEGAAYRKLRTACDAEEFVADVRERVAALPAERVSLCHVVVTFHVSTTHRLSGLKLLGKAACVLVASPPRREGVGGAGGSVSSAEAAANRTLLGLGDVLYAVHRQEKHVSYRNTKLTQLLRDCLGGLSKVLVVTHACSSPGRYADTVAALQFATRIGRVSLQKPRRAAQQTQLERSKEEAMKLQDELARTKTKLKGGESVFHLMQSMLHERERELANARASALLVEPLRTEQSALQERIRELEELSLSAVDAERVGSSSSDADAAHASRHARADRSRRRSRRARRTPAVAMELLSTQRECTGSSAPDSNGGEATDRPEGGATGEEAPVRVGQLKRGFRDSSASTLGPQSTSSETAQTGTSAPSAEQAIRGDDVALGGDAATAERAELVRELRVQRRRVGELERLVAHLQRELQSPAGPVRRSVPLGASPWITPPAGRGSFARTSSSDMGQSPRSGTSFRAGVTPLRLDEAYSSDEASTTSTVRPAVGNLQAPNLPSAAVLTPPSPLVVTAPQFDDEDFRVKVVVRVRGDASLRAAAREHLERAQRRCADVVRRRLALRVCELRQWLENTIFATEFAAPVDPDSEVVDYVSSSVDEHLAAFSFGSAVQRADTCYVEWILDLQPILGNLFDMEDALDDEGGLREISIDVELAEVLADKAANTSKRRDARAGSLTSTSTDASNARSAAGAYETLGGPAADMTAFMQQIQALVQNVSHAESQQALAARGISSGAGSVSSSPRRASVSGSATPPRRASVSGSATPPRRASVSGSANSTHLSVSSPLRSRRASYELARATSSTDEQSTGLDDGPPVPVRATLVEGPADSSAELSGHEAGIAEEHDELSGPPRPFVRRTPVHRRNRSWDSDVLGEWSGAGAQALALFAAVPPSVQTRSSRTDQPRRGGDGIPFAPSSPSGKFGEALTVVSPSPLRASENASAKLPNASQSGSAKGVEDEVPGRGATRLQGLAFREEEEKCAADCDNDAKIEDNPKRDDGVCGDEPNPNGIGPGNGGTAARGAEDGRCSGFSERGLEGQAASGGRGGTSGAPCAAENEQAGVGSQCEVTASETRRELEVHAISGDHAIGRRAPDDVDGEQAGVVSQRTDISSKTECWSESTGVAGEQRGDGEDMAAVSEPTVGSTITAPSGNLYQDDARGSAESAAGAAVSVHTSVRGAVSVPLSHADQELNHATALGEQQPMITPGVASSEHKAASGPRAAPSTDSGDARVGSADNLDRNAESGASLSDVEHTGNRPCRDSKEYLSDENPVPTVSSSAENTSRRARLRRSACMRGADAENGNSVESLDSSGDSGCEPEQVDTDSVPFSSNRASPTAERASSPRVFDVQRSRVRGLERQGAGAEGADKDSARAYERWETRQKQSRLSVLDILRGPEPPL